MLKRSKIYYKVDDHARVKSNAKVLPDECFERDEESINDQDERDIRYQSKMEFFDLVIAPKILGIIDLIVEIASVVGVFILLFNGINYLLKDD